ncbi:MAG: 3,4-dihydroxy-2-butanone-4-phosphate synthase [Nitrososphaeraceae archaeon]
MSTIDEAIFALRRGKFVLVHDDKNRENEIDMIVAGENATPKHIATMRNDAGGLLCLAIDGLISKKLGLLYLHDLFNSIPNTNNLFPAMTNGRSPYGDKPSFSISVNHRQTYTGITDNDRALTISMLASVCKNIDNGGISEFIRTFRTPGHVPLLIAAPGLLKERFGHTELAIYLAKLAGMTPTVAICEMLDSKTFNSLSIKEATKYAEKANIPLLESKQIQAYSVI